MYAFQPMTAVDLPLVRRWLKEPHVAKWWGEPSEQDALVTEDLDEPAMRQFIVSADGAPFGYLQCYDLTAWNTCFGAQPAGTRGIDLFIGEAGMLSRGHGSRLVRSFVEDEFSLGTPRIVADPDPANLRAIRIYEKSGFSREGLVDTPDGRSLLMVCNA